MTTFRRRGPAERRVVRDAVGLGVAVGSYGLSFGALAVGSGFSPAQACVLSLLAFTGGSQLAYVGVVGAGGGVGGALAGSLLLGLRNSLYGLQLSPTLGVRGPRRLLAAHVVIDETTAMSVAQPEPELARLAFRATAVSVYLCWNAATLAGALAGHAAGDPRRLGLDAAGPAAFLALLWPRVRPRGGRRDDRRAAAAGAGLAAAGTLVLPAGLPVVLAAVGVLAAR